MKTSHSKKKARGHLDPKDFRFSADWSTIDEPYEVTTPLIGRPNLKTFFRTHPGKDYVANVGVIEADGPYLVARKLYKDIGRDLRVQRVYTTIDCEGKARLWLLSIPDYDYYGRGLTIWNQTALDAVEMAKRDWIQLEWNAVTGCYRTHHVTHDLGDPGFDRLPPFSELFTAAFRGRLIADFDHPVIRKLHNLSEEKYVEYCERPGP